MVMVMAVGTARAHTLGQVCWCSVPFTETGYLNHDSSGGGGRALGPHHIGEETEAQGLSHLQCGP